MSKPNSPPPTTAYHTKSVKFQTTFEESTYNRRDSVYVPDLIHLGDKSQISSEECTCNPPPGHTCIIYIPLPSGTRTRQRRRPMGNRAPQRTNSPWLATTVCRKFQLHLKGFQTGYRVRSGMSLLEPHGAAEMTWRGARHVKPDTLGEVAELVCESWRDSGAEIPCAAWEEAALCLNLGRDWTWDLGILDDHKVAKHYTFSRLHPHDSTPSPTPPQIHSISPVPIPIPTALSPQISNIFLHGGTADGDLRRCWSTCDVSRPDFPTRFSQCNGIV